MNLNIIIGCGGIGGWVVRALAKMNEPVVLVDGDTVEESNLDRQLFTEAHIGMNKAQATVEAAGPFARGATAVPGFFTGGFIERQQLQDAGTPVFWCCADNHAARLATLNEVDAAGGVAIIGANETIDAEAYIYMPDWRTDPKRDPREFYKSLLDNDPFDPTQPRCTSAEALKYTPQLAVANMLAASYMGWLHHLWLRVAPEKDFEVQDYYPTRVNNTVSRLWATHHK